jgi:tripartite ATP-independent transporter DctM subunit
MSGFLVVLAFLALFMLGFPVVLAIGLPSIAYLLLNDLPLQMVAQRTLYALDSFPLVAVPVFLFVGSLMNTAGISKHIYRFADTAVGRLPGGLAQVNIFGSLVFAGMSGSALADIGGIGRIEIDAMKSKGFNPAFASAVTSSSAIVGPIFPPSIPLILYGTVTGVSVIQLLLGGILPALLCVAALMIMTAWLSVRRGYPRADRWPGWARLWADMKPALPALMAPVILIGGMLAGWFTPTEIAAVTVAYALLISSLFYRELTWARLIGAALETLRASSAILIIVAVAALFGWVLSVEQVPQAMTKFMLSISTEPWVLLLLVNVLLLVVGMFHRHPGDRPHHRQAPDGRGRGPGAPGHGGDLQPDDRPAHAAHGPGAVPGGRHRQGAHAGRAARDAALLRAAGGHAAADHLRAGDHAVVATPGRGLRD